MASPRGLSVNTPGSPSTGRVPQVYQIDFTAVASGKRIASSKRRVRWYVLPPDNNYFCVPVSKLVKKALKRMVKARGHGRHQSSDDDGSPKNLPLAHWLARAYFSFDRVKHMVLRNLKSLTFSQIFFV